MIGITTINNYRKMQEVESVLNIMRHRGKQVTSSDNEEISVKDDASADKSLVVETVESQIEPLQETQTPEGDGTKNPSEDAKQGEAGVADGAQKEGAVNASDDAKQEETRANTGVEKQEGTGDSADNADSQTGDNAQQSSEGNTQQTAAIQQEGDKRYYTVQAGDTLNTICLNIYQSKDMVKVLKEVNGIEDGDKILVGQRLLLP